MTQTWKNQGQILSNQWGQVPTVLKLDDRWRLYYSNRNNLNKSFICYIDVDLNDPKKIINHKSAPLLELGPPGTFDHNGNMPTCALKVDNLVYLYFIGWTCRKDVPFQNSIGLAISEDGGVSFSNKLNGPILSCSDSDPYFCGTINVIKEIDKWHGWYLSCSGWIDVNKKLEPSYTLKYATSVNGIKWLPKEEAIKREFPKYQTEAICNASVIKINNKYRMWYCYRSVFDYRDGPGSYKIGYAESTDRERWIRKDEEVCLEIQWWCEKMQCYPSISHHENKLYMFFNGNTFGKDGFGYATLNL